MRSARRLAAVLSAAAVIALAGASVAGARDPGRWLLTGASTIPDSYWQGLASDPAKANLYLTGAVRGLWSTTPQLRQTAGVRNEIPPAVASTAGYNHIGDPTWNPGDGGRVLLPMECFDQRTGDNTCGTGAFGVADPATLAFRYYVSLDPAEIPKAMWAETSPNGSLVWTSSGNDLLAYRSSDISASNAAPAGPVLHSVRRLPGAVPPTGVTGAVFRHGRLLLAGEKGGAYQVWAVNTRNGHRRLQVEMRICGESEGLDVIHTLGGRLHWLIAPFDPGCQLTFGPTSALLHFVRNPGRARFEVDVLKTIVSGVPGTVQATVRVTRGGRAVRDAQVSFAGGRSHTDGRGVATVSADLERPGRFKALARRCRAYGLSNLVPVGMPSTARSARLPRSNAG